MQPPAVWWNLASQWWALPQSDGIALWWALVHARYERPTAIRQHVALVQDAVKLHHFVQEVLTPQMAISVLEDLVHERRLSRKRASSMEQFVLDRVDCAGHWKKKEQPYGTDSCVSV